MALDLLLKQQADVFFALDTETPVVSEKDSGPDLPKIEDPDLNVPATKHLNSERQRSDRLQQLSYQRRRKKALVKRARLLSRMDRKVRKIDKYVDLLTLKHGPLAVQVEARMNVNGVEDGYLGDTEDE